MTCLRLGRWLLLGTLGLSACSDETLEPITPGPQGGAPATGGAGGAGGTGGRSEGGAPPVEGALVRVTMSGEVAVLLDELPMNMRDAVAAAVISQPSQFWIERAERQLLLTDDYRAYMPDLYIPLAPREAWSITLAPGLPERRTRDGHDVVSIAYTFESMLVSDAQTPAVFDPPLAATGDIREEKILLPADPDLLYARIADGCMTQQGYLNPYFYCAGTVQNVVGSRWAWRRYERLAWDPAIAEVARVGAINNPDGVDLEASSEGLGRHLIRYRYIPASSCAVSEGCVSGTGWRRLLEFDATVKNRGTAPLHIGAPFDGPWAEHNVFAYSACHQHMHFLFYGDYNLGSLEGDKRAFCLTSTSRYNNNEYTPLFTEYDFSCVYQGIAAGWGDDYAIGLDCQWVDITEIAEGGTVELSFLSNPDQFLCEGKPVLDAEGEPTFTPTEFKTETGQSIDRPACEFYEGWDANNLAKTNVEIPAQGGSYTQPCAGLLIGPRRSCGLSLLVDELACAPGTPVNLSCSVADPQSPQVVRICERSDALDVPIPCGYFDSRATELVSGTTQVTFTCPEPRDSAEPGGAYAIFGMPLVSNGAPQPITCVAQ